MKKKIVTAAELMKRLNADPAWVAARTAEEAERRKREAEYRLEEAPLTADLKAAGFDIESAWDLVNTSGPYTGALPILLKHLQKPYSGVIREGIARALAVPSAKFGWNIFVRLFREEQEKRVKDGLAVALANTVDEDTMDELISLVQNSQLGSSRVLLLRALGRSKKASALEALMRCVHDPDLHAEGHRILKRLNGRKKK
jgi:hypothetical protein